MLQPQGVPDLMDGFWSREPYFGFQTSFKYDAEKVMLDKYTIVEMLQTRVIYNWLQYFSRVSLTEELEGLGLAVESFLGDVAGADFDPGAQEFAVRGRKPAPSSLSV